MHELALAQEVLMRVVERADRERAERVVEVVLRIGRLNLVAPEALSFYFDVCKEATIAAGATLVIEDVPGRAYCPTCARVLELDHPLAVCPARHGELEWIAGFELVVAQMRIEGREDQPCAEPVAAANRQTS